MKSSGCTENCSGWPQGGDNLEVACKSECLAALRNLNLVAPYFSIVFESPLSET